MTAPPPDIEGPFLHGQSSTPFQENTQWTPIKETEAKIRKESQGEIDRLERVINLGKRMLSIKSSPGFQQFEAALKDLRTHSQNEMVGCTAANEQLRILQGRCQAFGSILALMRNTEQNLQSLAQQLETAQHKAASIIREDGKVVPEPAAGGI